MALVDSSLYMYADHVVVEEPHGEPPAGGAVEKKVREKNKREGVYTPARRTYMA
jgi:hypothetical protein